MTSTRGLEDLLAISGLGARRRVCPRQRTLTPHRRQPNPRRGVVVRTTPAQGNNKGEQEGEQAHVVSSLNSITTTAPSSADRELAASFLEALGRFGFSHVLGPNDLLHLWRSGRSASPQELVESVEPSEQSKGIDHPKAFAMKQLRNNGFYGCPANFKSWEEAKIEAKRRRAAELREIHRRAFDAEFELWRAGLSSAERKQILESHLK